MKLLFSPILPLQNVPLVEKISENLKTNLSLLLKLNCMSVRRKMRTQLKVAKMNSTQECASSQMSFECGTYRSCELCTQKHNCMWCGILGTCVSNEAHVTSFPFGQCHEWFQKQHCFKTTCKVSVSSMRKQYTLTIQDKFFSKKLVFFLFSV